MKNNQFAVIMIVTNTHQALIVLQKNLSVDGMQ